MNIRTADYDESCRVIPPGLILSGVLMADSGFDETQAVRFARLALDSASPRISTGVLRLLRLALRGSPHWLPGRLTRRFLNAQFAPEARN